MERTVTPRHALTLFVALILSLTVALPLTRAQGPVPIGRSLRAALASATPTTRLQVIVTFKGTGAPTAANVAGLRLAGITAARTMRALPIAGVLATPAQISALANRSDVRSLWLNEQLSYDNHEATALTGVDRLRTDSRLRTAAGLPFTGKGIGVVINDSGVDGTHLDVQYGDHLVQNVQGQTNLHAVDTMLPITYVEGVPNTDHGGGHGTHVAGIIGATGARSAGYHEGVAPGANLIGYGSGAALLILDTIGGFDYALVNQARYNIRVISNSFGNTGDVNTDFDPNDPTNVATKALADRGVVVVFSAGNSGSGEGSVTGNFKKAPWVVMVAAGNKEGELAGFSSRGRKNVGGTVDLDGQTYTWLDRPTVTAPGVGIVSVRASTGGSASGLDADLVLPPAYLPFYTVLDGTSMACPHVSGIVALMLEANPALNVYDVRRILEATATNMAGRESYEVGAGYVNAYNAVVAALGRRTDFGATGLAGQTFNSSIALNDLTQAHSLTFDPTGATTKAATFTVAPGTAQLAGRVSVGGLVGESGNTVGLRFTGPDGTRYTSGVTALFAISYLRSVVVDNPKPGTWTVDLYGANGAGVPETATATVVQRQGGSSTGLADIAGHAAQGAILAAVADRLVDGLPGGVYDPDAALTRAQLATYLTFGAGVRQSLPLAGSTFTDVPAGLAPYAEAVAARGAALKDVFYAAGPVVRTSGGLFRPDDAVTRLDLAYSLVQSLGLEGVARGFSGTPEAEYNGQKLALSDADAIPADLRGYVQLAISLGILDARFGIEQGPFDLQPTIKARFDGAATVTRGAYAVAATRFFTRYTQAGLAASLSTTESTGPAPALSQTPTAPALRPATLGFEAIAPNPARGTATVRFHLPEAQRVRLAVYDAVGREVAVLADGELAAGNHTSQFAGEGLAAGVYVMRLLSPSGVLTRTVTLVR